MAQRMLLGLVVLGVVVLVAAVAPPGRSAQEEATPADGGRVVLRNTPPLQSARAALLAEWDDEGVIRCELTLKGFCAALHRLDAATGSPEATRAEVARFVAWSGQSDWGGCSRAFWIAVDRLWWQRHSGKPGASPHLCAQDGGVDDPVVMSGLLADPELGHFTLFGSCDRLWGGCPDAGRPARRVPILTWSAPDGRAALFHVYQGEPGSGCGMRIERASDGATFCAVLGEWDPRWATWWGR